MIYDVTTLISNSQAITGTANSTDFIDLGATGRVFGTGVNLTRDIGKGGMLSFLVQVVQTFNNLTTLQVQLQVATDTAFTSPVTIAVSPAVPLAQLVAGYSFPQFNYSIPAGANLRYFRAAYAVVGTAPTLGRVTAGFNMGVQTNSGNP